MSFWDETLRGKNYNFRSGKKRYAAGVVINTLKLNANNTTNKQIK